MNKHEENIMLVMIVSILGLGMLCAASIYYSPTDPCNFNSRFARAANWDLPDRCCI